MLDELFRLQADLNKRSGFDAHALRENFDPLVAGKWIDNYLKALTNEVEELRDCTYWKHWAQETKDGRRYELHDVQNARVEVIDMLHFWISLAHCVGLNAKEVFDLYVKKNKVNHTRQDTNYSMASKTEDDNKDLKV